MSGRSQHESSTPDVRRVGPPRRTQYDDLFPLFLFYDPTPSSLPAPTIYTRTKEDLQGG